MCELISTYQKKKKSKKKSAGGGINCRTFSPNPRTRGKSHHHRDHVPGTSSYFSAYSPWPWVRLTPCSDRKHCWGFRKKPPLQVRLAWNTALLCPWFSKMREREKKRGENVERKIPEKQNKVCLFFLLACSFVCFTFFLLLSPLAHLHVVGMLLRFISDINQPTLPTLFLFCSSVCFCLYGPFNCISFHKCSWQLYAFSLCSSGLIAAKLVFSTIYLFTKVSLSPDIIHCGWVDLKRQLTN